MSPSTEPTVLKDYGLLGALVVPRFGGIAFLDSGDLGCGVDVVQFNSIDVMPRIEWRRRRLWETSIYSRSALGQPAPVIESPGIAAEFESSLSTDLARIEVVSIDAALDLVDVAQAASRA